MLVGLFGMCVQFARFSKAQLQVPAEQAFRAINGGFGKVANASPALVAPPLGNRGVQKLRGSLPLPGRRPCRP